MKLVTKSKDLAEAVFWANKYVNSEDFEKDILSVQQYEYADVTPQQIAELFRKEQFNRVTIILSYFGFFYRRVLGRTVGDGFAYINSWNIGRSIWSVAATVVHEACHIVDERYPKASFGHGNNSANGKSLTFPYFIDERAELWIKKEVLKAEANRLAKRHLNLREAIV